MQPCYLVQKYSLGSLDFILLQYAFPLKQVVPLALDPLQWKGIFGSGCSVSLSMQNRYIPFKISSLEKTRQILSKFTLRQQQPCDECGQHKYLYSN